MPAPSRRSFGPTLGLLFGLGAAAVGGCVGGGDGEPLTVTSVGLSEQIPATVLKPDGPGPFPAVVIVHDCSGLGLRSSGAPLRWAQALVKQGYVATMPDSFLPRGMWFGVCTLPYRESKLANPYIRARDAYGALAAVRKLPYVDGKRIAIMGGSHGGITALAAMYKTTQPDDPLLEAKRDGFVAAIALYPQCQLPFGAWEPERRHEGPGPADALTGVYEPIAPVLILIGEKDDWTPAEPCRIMVERSREAGHPMDIKIYPGAYHSFDSPASVYYDPNRDNFFSWSGKGATTGGDAAAWADAEKQVAAFLAKHLKQ